MQEEVVNMKGFRGFDEFVGFEASLKMRLSNDEAFNLIDPFKELSGFKSLGAMKLNKDRFLVKGDAARALRYCSMASSDDAGINSAITKELSAKYALPKKYDDYRKIVSAYYEKDNKANIGDEREKKVNLSELIKLKDEIMAEIDKESSRDLVAYKIAKYGSELMTIIHQNVNFDNNFLHAELEKHYDFMMNLIDHPFIQCDSSANRFFKGINKESFQNLARRKENALFNTLEHSEYSEYSEHSEQILREFESAVGANTQRGPNSEKNGKVVLKDNLSNRLVEKYKMLMSDFAKLSQDLQKKGHALVTSIITSFAPKKNLTEQGKQAKALFWTMADDLLSLMKASTQNKAAIDVKEHNISEEEQNEVFESCYQQLGSVLEAIHGDCYYMTNTLPRRPTEKIILPSTANALSYINNMLDWAFKNGCGDNLVGFLKTKISESKWDISRLAECNQCLAGTSCNGGDFQPQWVNNITKHLTDKPNHSITPTQFSLS